MIGNGVVDLDWLSGARRGMSRACLFFAFFDFTSCRYGMYKKASWFWFVLFLSFHGMSLSNGLISVIGALGYIFFG